MDLFNVFMMPPDTGNVVIVQFAGFDCPPPAPSRFVEWREVGDPNVLQESVKGAFRQAGSRRDDRISAP
jgi:hypothetical protein